MELKDKIIQARTKIGITQTDLAKQLKKTPQAVQQWESGETKPRDLVAVSRALGVSYDWLKGNVSFSSDSLSDDVESFSTGVFVKNEKEIELLRSFRRLTEKQQNEIGREVKKIDQDNQEIVDRYNELQNNKDVA